MLLHASMCIHSHLYTPHPYPTSSTLHHAPAMSWHHRWWLMQHSHTHLPKWALPTLCTSNSHFGHKTMLHTLAPASPTRFILGTHPTWFFTSWLVQMCPDCASGRFNLSTALCWVAYAFHYLYLTGYSLVSIFYIWNYFTIVSVSSNDAPSSVCVTP